MTTVMACPEPGDHISVPGNAVRVGTQYGAYRHHMLVTGAEKFANGFKINVIHISKANGVYESCEYFEPKEWRCHPYRCCFSGSKAIC